MSSKYELSISTSYVPDWNITDAFRELFQNAYDMEIQNPENKMNWERVEDKVIIGNKESDLSRDTLLLGSSTKRDDCRTIGQHGEGYKIAFMVLLREGKKVTVYNYGAREIWEVKLVNSRRYNGEKIVTVFITKQAFWKDVPNSNLTIEVSGITDEEYADIVEHNINLQDTSQETIPRTKNCRVLTGEKFRGKVYVKGLYVSGLPGFNYGYDFSPEVIKLDRDRKMASLFDSQWEASLAWAELSNIKEYSQIVIDMVKAQAPDVHFIDRFNAYNVSTLVADDFYKEHGTNAVPVINNYEYDKIKEIHYKPIIVTENVKSLVTKSSSYIEPKSDTKDLKSEFKEFAESISEKLTENERNILNGLIERIEN